MNRNINKFLKFLSRGLGYLLINLTITLIFFAFFANLSLQETDKLKENLQNYILEQSNITKEEFNTLKSLCEQNPNQEGCEFFKQNPIDNLATKINSYKNYFSIILFIIISLFSFGFIFIFLGSNNFLDAIHKISLNLSLQSFFAAFCYKFLPNILNSLLNTNYFIELAKNVSQEEINKVLSIILNWLARPLIKTFNLAILLGIIFLIITIILSIVKKKNINKLKSSNK